jgi:hypothetical protein
MSSSVFNLKVGCIRPDSIAFVNADLTFSSTIPKKSPGNVIYPAINDWASGGVMSAVPLFFDVSATGARQALACRGLFLAPRPVSESRRTPFSDNPDPGERIRSIARFAMTRDAFSSAFSLVLQPRQSKMA